MPTPLPRSSRANASLSAPGFGSVDLYVIELFHGMNVISSQAEARATSTFYPKLRTSGSWGVEVVFPARYAYTIFNFWLAKYITAISNPYRATPQPMTLNVPSRNFLKQGFPESPAEFGDEFRSFTYRQRLEFCSASDPTTQASRFVSATNDNEAIYFYPGGRQLSELDNPSRDPYESIEPNLPYDRPGSSPIYRS